MKQVVTAGGREREREVGNHYESTHTFQTETYVNRVLKSKQIAFVSFFLPPPKKNQRQTKEKKESTNQQALEHTESNKFSLPPFDSDLFTYVRMLDVRMCTHTNGAMCVRSNKIA